MKQTCEKGRYVLEIKRYDGNWNKTAKIADNLGLKLMRELCAIDNRKTKEIIYKLR